MWSLSALIELDFNVRGFLMQLLTKYICYFLKSSVGDVHHRTGEFSSFTGEFFRFTGEFFKILAIFQEILANFQNYWRKPQFYWRKFRQKIGRGCLKDNLYRFTKNLREFIRCNEARRGRETLHPSQMLTNLNCQSSLCPQN